MSSVMVNEQKRKESVKVTVTGVELFALQADYDEARRNADRLAGETRDGAGSLSELARLAVEQAEMAAYAHALYRLTGDVAWRLRHEQATRASSATVVTVGSRQRAIEQSR
jgi:hypothetical protein